MNPTQLDDLIRRLQDLSERSGKYHKLLAVHLETHVLSNGVDPAVIGAEANRLAQSWGLLD